LYYKYYLFINKLIMSKRNLLLLALWYIAGWLVASVYSKKKPEELKKEMETSKAMWEWEFKVLLNNFVETHKSIINDIKTHINNDKNKEYYITKKDELLKILDSYKNQWVDLLEELKIKWKSYISEAKVRLEKLYNEKSGEIDAIKEIAPEKLNEIKDKLKGIFDEMKSKIK